MMSTSTSTQMISSGIAISVAISMGCPFGGSRAAPHGEAVSVVAVGCLVTVTVFSTVVVVVGTLTVTSVELLVVTVFARVTVWVSSSPEFAMSTPPATPSASATNASRTTPHGLRCCSRGGGAGCIGVLIAAQSSVEQGDRASPESGDIARLAGQARDPVA
jgi:hypothetical protein